MFEPLLELKNKIRSLIYNSLTAQGFNISKGDISVEETKNRAHGDFFSNIAFKLAKQVSTDKKSIRNLANSLAEQVVKALQKDAPPWLEAITAKSGYINFKLNRGLFAKYVLEGILGEPKYGCTERISKKIIVEHTSANPAHPLHVGHARNAFIGDSIANMLDYCEANVKRHFYINDCGKQIAILAYVYDKLKTPQPKNVKVDHFLGVLYTIATNLLERNNILLRLYRLKKALYSDIQAKIEASKLNEWILGNYIRLFTVDIIKIKQSIKNTNSNETVYTKLSALLDKLKNVTEILNQIQSKWPRLYLKTLTAASDIRSRFISELMIKYEKQEQKTKELIRKLVKNVLNGFLETLNFLGIRFDLFDWESEFLWTGLVEDILRKLETRGYLIRSKKTKVTFLNARRILKDFPELQQAFFERGKKIPLDKIKNPPLTRRDGTSLYLLRDIAYGYYKLYIKNADIAVNVIGIDQKLEQKYVILALKALGVKNVETRYRHIMYELVRLPDIKMSSRRGQYVTLDEIIIETIIRALKEVESRYPEFNNYQKYAFAKAIAISALKYALLAQAPTKIITFDWNRILDFEQNSGPFVQYAHARASAILRKVHWKLPRNADLTLLDKPEEFELIYLMAKFPEILRESIRSYRPDILANYANNLAIAFNKFYQKHPVLKATNENLRAARLYLVFTFRRVLSTVLKLLGIHPLYRM